MKFDAGLADESFKLCVGSDVFCNDRDVYPVKTRELVAARGMDAAFQMVVRSDGDALLALGEESAFSRFGMVDCYRIGFQFDFPVTAAHIGMVTDDNLLNMADILLSQPTAELSAGVPASVYVKLAIPQDARPGQYHGTLCVWHSKGFSEETCIEKLHFNVEVYGYRMKPVKDWKFHLDLWQHSSNIARKAELPLWSDEHFKVLKPYLKTLAELGQKSITVVASEIPWVGQTCFMDHRNPSDLYEYSMVRVYETAKDQYRIDFSAMDRYIALCGECGFPGNSEIEIFGIINIWQTDQYGFTGPAADYPEAIRIRVRKQDGSYGYMRSKEKIDWYIKELEKHFIENGTVNRARIAADEPADMERFRSSMTNIQAIAPAFRFKAAINHVEFINEFAQQIDDFVPSYSCMISERELLSRLKTAVPERQFSWYVCCEPDFPNTFIKSNLLEARSIGYITMAESLDGFLRWNYTVWPQKPRKDLRYPAFPCGDMNFVYPAGDMRPLLSLRYQSLKRGIEDFELLYELKSCGMADEASKVLSTIIKTGKYVSPVNRKEELISLRPEDYLQARKKMLALLSNIKK